MKETFMVIKIFHEKLFIISKIEFKSHFLYIQNNIKTSY